MQNQFSYSSVAKDLGLSQLESEPNSFWAKSSQVLCWKDLIQIQPNYSWYKIYKLLAQVKLTQVKSSQPHHFWQLVRPHWFVPPHSSMHWGSFITKSYYVKSIYCWISLSLESFMITKMRQNGHKTNSVGLENAVFGFIWALSWNTLLLSQLIYCTHSCLPKGLTHALPCGCLAHYWSILLHSHILCRLLGPPLVQVIMWLSHDWF
jgi:hypothetical protein